MYSSFARKLFEATDSNEAAVEIKAFIQKLRERRPSMDEVRLGFRDVTFTNSTTKQKSLVRYILRKFAEKDSFKFTVDWDEVTIEHVAPQAYIGTGEWTESVVGQVGNLFLLDPKKNGELADKPFGKKMEILAGGQYSVPGAISNASEWTPENVRAHTDAMAIVAHEEIWKI